MACVQQLAELTPWSEKLQSIKNRMCIIVNYPNSQRAGVILYPTAVLFHYIFYLFYKFWQIVRHKIFFKIREHILKEQQMLILCVLKCFL